MAREFSGALPAMQAFAARHGTAEFLSGLISALPPLHELARDAGLDLPTYLGKLQREAGIADAPAKSTPPPSSPKAKPDSKNRRRDASAGSATALHA